MKSNTKQQIIQTALRLFNQWGVAKVSTRKIADEMGIAHGNVTYHYLKKEQIIEVIYTQMFEEMEGKIGSNHQVDFSFVQQLFTYYYQFQYRYRFFFLDIVEINRQFPEIAKQHLETQQKRVNEGLLLLQALVKQELLIAEPRTGTYAQVAHLTWFINNFWMGQQWVFGQKPEPKDTQATLQMIWQLLMPYFTEKGWKAYENLNLHTLKP